MAKTKIPPSVICTGLICLTVLELFAIREGFNGTLLKAVLVAIALTIGIAIPTPNIRK